MSVSKWRYTEACDGDYCCGDCDCCSKEPEEGEWVKKGKNIWNFDIIECSACGERQVTNRRPTECPNCGADMRGEENA